MTLADCTAPDLIVPQLQGRDAAGVIQELSQALQRAGHVSDLLRFYHTALNRELLVSSEVESGAAFPHGRVPGLSSVVFALGRSETPMTWGANAMQAVSVVFLVAVPEGDTRQYLNLVCGLTHLAKSHALMDRLRRAGDFGEILRVLGEVTLRSAQDQSSGSDADLADTPGGGARPS